MIFLAKIKCLWQIKTICHYFFCNLIDIHTHTQHGLFDNQAGGSGSARSTRLVAMRCALCTSVQALSRVGWCHRCARVRSICSARTHGWNHDKSARARYRSAGLVEWQRWRRREKLSISSISGISFMAAWSTYWVKDALTGVFTKCYVGFTEKCQNSINIELFYWENILLTFDTTTYYKGHSSKNINMKFDSWYVKKWLIQLLWVYLNIFACMHGKAYKGGIMLENILILYSSIAQI